MVGRGKDSVGKLTKCQVANGGENPTNSVCRVRILPIKKRPLSKSFKWWAGVDSNHRSLATADLQSAPFSHSGTDPRRIIFSFQILVLDCVGAPTGRPLRDLSLKNDT